MGPAPARLAVDGARIVHAPAVPAALAAEWLRERERWLASAPAGPLDSPLGPLFVKRERPSFARTAFARIGLARLGLARSRSARAFALGRAFLAAGLATPEPLAWLEARRPSRGTLLVARFETGLDPWSFLASAPDAARTTRALAALGRAVAGLHARGFRHRDLKAPNLLLAEADGTIRVSFLDLDGAARCRRPSDAVRTRDLARLAASLDSPAAARAAPADAWPALLDAYLEATPPGERPERAGLLARTAAWAGRHAEEHRRSGRPSA